MPPHKQKREPQASSRRDVLRSAIAAAMLPSITLLDSQTTPAKALDLLRSETIASAIERFYTATEEELDESLGYILHHPTLAPEGLAVDIHRAIVKKSPQEIQGSGMETFLTVFYTMQSEGMHNSQETVVYRAHTHTTAGITEAFGEEYAKVIQKLGGAIVGIPSTADFDNSAQDGLNAVGAYLGVLDPAFKDIPSFKKIELVFTNAGVYVTKKSPLSAVSTTPLSEQARQRREQKWTQMNRFWILFVNSVLHKSPNGWDVILQSPQYRELQKYVHDTFGMSMEFIPRKRTTKERLLEFATRP